MIQLELVSFHILSESPLTTLQQTLLALVDAGFVAGPMSADPKQADVLLASQLSPPAKNLVASLRASSKPAAAATSLLEGLRESPNTQTNQRQPLYIYFQLTPPVQLCARSAADYIEKLGPPPKPPALVLIPPHEVWVALDLGDPAGARQTARLVNRRCGPAPGLLPPILTLTDTGEACAVRAKGAFELRTTAENAQYLAFALTRPGIASNARAVFAHRMPQ